MHRGQALSVALLLITVGALNGCESHAPAAPRDDTPIRRDSLGEREPSGSAVIRGEGEQIAQANALLQTGLVGQVAEDAAPDDDVPQAQNPLIRGVQQLLDSTLGAADFSEERDQLGESLSEADAILTRVKRENRSALRQASRQVRVLSPASPNVILIVTEGLRTTDLGCYGGQSVPTPHIDRLAAEGLRFTGFGPTRSSATLSRWALVTGLEPADGEEAILHPDHMSLGEVMWQAGYATGFIGLWGIPESARKQGPNAHGFDEWLGYFRDDETETDYPAYLWSNSSKIKLSANANGRRGQSASEFLAQESLSFVERHYRRRPFFLTVVLPTPGSAADRDGTSRSERIAALDHDLGELLDQLSQLGIDRHTAICLTSVSDTTGETAVPLLVRWPGRIQAGRVSDYPVAMQDFLPTFADVVGAFRRPRQIDGRSLLSTWTARENTDAPVGD